MFTKDDYDKFFKELEGLIRDQLTITTDLLTVLESREIRNRLGVIMNEDAEAFYLIRQEHEHFVKEQKA